MSSSRRRSSPSNGSATSSAAQPSSSPSTSATTTRRSRRNGSSSSSNSSKKRRYEGIVNRCRNPFCGAELENKHQRYCEASRICQLHRGIMLSCAWPNAPSDKGVAVAEETSAASTRSGSSAVDTPATAATAPRRSSASNASTAGASGDVAMVGSDKRQRTATQSTPGESSGGTKRLKLDGSSMASASATAAPSAAPVATAITAVRQVKAAAIEVVPLGIGNRGGGGGRYVQSGNRTAGAPSLPPPSVSTTSTASEVPATRAASPLQPSPRGLLPPPGSSLAAAPPSRTLSRANSLPVTITNKSRDPRVRANVSTATPGGGSNDADAAATTNGGLKLISPADYLNNRRNRATTSEPPATGGVANSSVGSMAPISETLLSSRPPDYHRTLERTTSSSSVTHADSGSSSFRSSASAFSDSSRQLRRASSDTTTSFSSHESVKTDRYPPHGQPHASAYHGSSMSAAAAGDRGYAEYHHDRSQHQQDRPPLSRTSSSASVTSASHPSPAAYSHVSSSEPRLSRAERLFTSLIRPTFSHSDPFLRLIITRMASFLPNALSPIRNKTTKPRKLQFYLDYAERVHKYCGRMVKIDVKVGVARFAVAGREWLSITGSSTSNMYQDILEKILTDSERWRDLILEAKRMLSEDQRRLGSHAIPGVTFLKFWSSMKKRTAEKASDFDFQSSLVVGKTKYHWTFAAGNVEIGSGSAKEKLKGFKNAASSAADFVKDLTILPDGDKHKVAKDDSEGVSDRTSPRSTRSSPTNRISAIRESTESSSRRSSASDRPAAISTPAAPSRGAVGAPGAPTPLTTTQVPTPSSSTAATTKRIVEEPSAASAAAVATVGELSPPRARSDSWTDRADPNQATFSPIVRSDSDEEHDSDRMSISDTEDEAPQATGAAPSVVAATTATVATAGNPVAATSTASVPPAATEQQSAQAPVRSPAPVPASAPALAPPSTPAPAPSPAPAPAPVPAPTPVSALTSTPAPGPTQQSVTPAPPPPSAAPAPVLAPPSVPTRAAVTIPAGPSAAPTPLVSPSCRFCAGIQKTNPTAKCLRCQKSQPKAASAALTSSAKPTDATQTTTAKRAIDSLHLFLQNNVVQPVKSSVAKAFALGSTDSTATTNASSSTSSANVIESLPSSTASTPRNEVKK